MSRHSSRSVSLHRIGPATRPLLALALLLGAAAAVPAQSGPILQHSDGSAVQQAYGAILAGCADLDGDGVRDLLIGSSEYGTFKGLQRAVSGATGAVIHAWTEATHGDGIADAGDVDGDGVTDVLVGDLFSSPNFSAEGSAWVYSGATGLQIHRFNGGGAQRYLGGDVGGLGDINGDGRSDVIIGAWGEKGKANFSGVVYVRSGMDGSIIHRIEGSFDHGYFGNSVTGVPDVNADGVPDFAVGAVGESTLGSDTGAVYLYSGATGALLRHWTGEHGNARFGGSVRDVGDADGDGAGDLAVGAIFNPPNGRAYLLSGASGAVLHTWDGYNPDEVFGQSVDGAGDLDRDGLGDVIVGSDHFYVAAGYTGFVYAFSGRTGELLHDFRAGSTTGRLGNAVCGVGDVNGDGVPDMAAGAITETTPGGFQSGRVYLFSGKRSGLLFDVTSFDGGAVSTFRLVGAQAGSLAAFAVSLTGNAPAPTAFGTIVLTPPILVLSFTPVAANGEAEFSLPLPAAATGVVVHAQAVELYAGGGGKASYGRTLEVH